MAGMGETVYDFPHNLHSSELQDKQEGQWEVEGQRTPDWWRKAIAANGRNHLASKAYYGQDAGCCGG